MKNKLLKKLRDDAKERVYVEEPAPYSWYLSITTGADNDESLPKRIYIVNDAPMAYINKQLNKMRIAYIQRQLKKLKDGKE